MGKDRLVWFSSFKHLMRNKPARGAPEVCTSLGMRTVIVAAEPDLTAMMLEAETPLMSLFNVML